ncbi:hypothetical protein DPMN_036798 [Dreissena polymorpha]|uniref:Uncharacterized protein n=1 Tax=Dreissena polymorpha TaxID=45954 RepID=A0A9D4MA32_DREPO|nr:hypothetical protein DPMN_036798 [Dreissena polymorpha]
MNLNTRELHQHVEFEPDTYYAAFSAELEISASPMWSLISHLRREVEQFNPFPLKSKVKMALCKQHKTRTACE